MIHWKAGHYAALVKEQNGRYLVQDPTFGDEFWMSRARWTSRAASFWWLADGCRPAGMR